MTNEQRETIREVIGAMFVISNCSDEKIGQCACDYAEILQDMLAKDLIDHKDPEDMVYPEDKCEGCQWLE